MTKIFIKEILRKIGKTCVYYPIFPRHADDEVGLTLFWHRAQYSFLHCLGAETSFTYLCRPLFHSGTSSTFGPVQSRATRHERTDRLCPWSITKFDAQSICFELHCNQADHGTQSKCRRKDWQRTATTGNLLDNYQCTHCHRWCIYCQYVSVKMTFQPKQTSSACFLRYGRPRSADHVVSGCSTEHIDFNGSNIFFLFLALIFVSTISHWSRLTDYRVNFLRHRTEICSSHRSKTTSQDGAHFSAPSRIVWIIRPKNWIACHFVPMWISSVRN